MTALTGFPGTVLPRERIVAGLVAIVVTGTAFALGLAFAWQPMPAGLAALAVLAVVACLAKPQAATYIVVGILYSNAAAIAVRDHGVPAIVGFAFPLLLALPLADHLLLKRRTVTITAALPFLFGFMVIQVLGVLAARDPSDALSYLLVFASGGFALYFLVTNVVRSFSVLRSAVWTVLAIGAVLGALSTFQAVTGTYANDYWGFSTVDIPGEGSEVALASLEGTPRHEGPIGEINRYAQVLLVLLPIGALLALAERRKALRLLAAGLTVLILCGMATTFSRGAAFGLLVVIAGAVLFRYVRVLHLALLAAALALVLMAFPTYGERLLDLQALTSLDRGQGGAPVEGDASNLRGRATETLAALLLWADHPVIGVGRGQFGQYYEQYAGAVAETGVDTRIDAGELRQAHNLYTGIAAETGGLGFVFFMTVFLITMRDLRRARRALLLRHPEMAHMVSGFYLALVGYLASGMALHLAYERYLWLLLALAGVAAHLALKGLEDGDFQLASDGLSRRGSELRVDRAPAS